MAKILRIMMAVLATLFVGYSAPRVSAQAPVEVEILVSSTKGAPGQNIPPIPIYISSDVAFEASMVDFVLRWDPEVLKFVDILTDDRTEVGFADDAHVWEFTRPSRAEMHFAFNVPHIFSGTSLKPGILLFADFEVIGERGAVGEISIENFKIDGANVSASILNAEFRVLPAAIYYNDRNYVEITASEVFTSFELELTGELDYSIAESNWVFEQEGDFITGRSPNPDQGATSLNVPISSENVIVYSLKLNDNEVVQFIERPPDPLKLFVPLLVND